MIDTLKQLAPEIVESLGNLAKLALAGATKTEILTEAEKLAELVAYKRSYRRGP